MSASDGLVDRILDALPNACCESERHQCPYDHFDAETLAAEVRRYIGEIPGELIARAWLEPQQVVGKAGTSEYVAEWRARSVKVALNRALGGSV